MALTRVRLLTVPLMAALLAASSFGLVATAADEEGGPTPEGAMEAAWDLMNQSAAGGAVDYEGDSGLTVGILIPWLDNDGFQAFYVGLVSEAIARDASVYALNANHSPEKALSAIEAMITQGVDAIVVDPFDAASVSAGIEKANEAGIPVVVYDQKAAYGDVAGFIETDNVAIGARSADLIVEAAERDGLTKDDLKIIELVGDLAGGAGVDRHEGFKTQAEALGLNVVAEVPTLWDPAKANSGILDAFTAHPDANAIVSASGCALFVGTQSALEASDKWIPIGEEGHIYLVDSDGCPGPIQAIRDGYQDGDAMQPLVQIGQQAVGMAIDTVNGITLDETEIHMPPVLITQDNVDDPTHWANVLASFQQ